MLTVTGLLTDVNSVRHTTLQNRTAINFLLLTHRHKCKDFDKMYCINLSNHSQSIHASIKPLQNKVTKLKIVDKTN